MTELYLLAVQILLVLAAFFAASEASLFSLSTFQVESLTGQYPKLSTLIKRLLAKPEALLSTLIIGNELVSILLSTCVTSLMLTRFSSLPILSLMLISMVISFGLLLTFSEVIPKVIAFRIPTVFSILFTYPTFAFYQLFKPIRHVFIAISKSLINFFGLKQTVDSSINEKDFLTLVEAGAESGTVNFEEKELIYNVFHFSDLTIARLLVPWAQVFTLFDNMTFLEALPLVKSKRYSRIPVVSYETKEVVGVLYTKELLKQMLYSPQDTLQKKMIKEIVVTPFIVSSHKKVGRLFTELLRKKIHLALVVDEYGHHKGIVTLEDLLNTLFNQKKPSLLSLPLS